jgi:hypothetical protein
MRQIPLIIYFFIIPAFCFSQKENNIWYFGDMAGIDYSSGSPIALTDSPMQSIEGTATISDTNGNLLFYTNGGTLYGSFIGAVWNRNHLIMPNGNMDSTGGCHSSQQSSLIIPRPGNPNEYYLFTTDCWENLVAGGLRYSIIDMSLDGGLGDVTIKGIPVIDSVVESLYGLKHSNGNDYWVIVHRLNNNSFYSYQITNTGILPPVITNIGFPVPTGGQITATIDGSKIGYGSIDHTMLFDFNNATGVLSNFIDLKKEMTSCAFSANCKYFYANHPGPFGVPYWDSVFQFDLQAADVAASAYFIAAPIYYLGESMQLAPDGKIYIAKQGLYLDVINNPDLHGNLCNYISDGLYLGGRNCSYCLPNMLNSFYVNCSSTEGQESNKNSCLKDLILYPNPFGISATVEFENPKNEKCSLYIFDSFGRNMRTITDIITSKIIIERQDLKGGMYFFQMRTDKQIISTGKLMIE